MIKISFKIILVEIRENIYNDLANNGDKYKEIKTFIIA